jgi:hypothetical protein
VVKIRQKLPYISCAFHCISAYEIHQLRVNFTHNFMSCIICLVCIPIQAFSFIKSPRQAGCPHSRGRLFCFASPGRLTSQIFFTALSPLCCLAKSSNSAHSMCVCLFENDFICHKVTNNMRQG